MSNCNNNKCMLRRRITAYDFAMYELVEYLDTHPNDIRALRLREDYQAKRADCVREYEAQFGPYIVTANDVTGDRWSWIDNPWPWEYGKEC